jgi:CRP-like cAMP-binding protein
VIAIRDTSVLVLMRAAYQSLAEDTPAIAEALLAALALRFAQRTERLPTIRTSPMARTAALIDGGLEPVPGGFDRCMREALARTDAEVVDPARVEATFRGGHWMSRRAGSERQSGHRRDPRQRRFVAGSVAGMPLGLRAGIGS